MKVRELIELLEQWGEPDAEVMFAHPSHDYWRRELASPVRKVEEEALVEYSEYHRQDKVVDLDEIEGDPLSDERRSVLLLR